MWAAILGILLEFWYPVSNQTPAVALATYMCFCLLPFYNVCHEGWRHKLFCYA
jgi:hypothetical protein